MRRQLFSAYRVKELKTNLSSNLTHSRENLSVYANTINDSLGTLLHDIINGRSTVNLAPISIGAISVREAIINFLYDVIDTPRRRLSKFDKSASCDDDDRRYDKKDPSKLDYYPTPYDVCNVIANCCNDISSRDEESLINSSVVELCCGDGRILKKLSDSGFNTICGVDIDEARKEQFLNNNPDCEFFCKDVFSINYGNHFFVCNPPFGNKQETFLRSPVKTLNGAGMMKNLMVITSSFHDPR